MPFVPAALLTRARVYHAQKQTQLAVADLDALIAARPLMDDMHLLRASFNLELGDRAKALDDIRTVLAQQPDNASLNRNAGILNWDVDQLPQAEKNFHRAAEQGKGDIYAWLFLALTDLRMGQAVPSRDVPDYKDAEWPAPLVHFFLSQGDGESVMKAAGEGKADVIAAQVCTADFFLGEWRLLHQDAAGAKPLIAKAAAECDDGLIMAMPARLELESLP